MVFSSVLFIFIFLPIVLGGYFLIANKYKNWWLFIVSLIFFSWSQPKYVTIILASIIINYIFAILVEKAKLLKKFYLFLSIIANLSILFVFKYLDFSISLINQYGGYNYALYNIVLPIGLSFFTFQGMSYVFDVYQNTTKASRNILKVGLYIVLFPQLVAGPIVRFSDIAEQLDNPKINLDKFSYGIERFIIGLSKKVILANTFAVTADKIWNAPFDTVTCSMAWLGSIAYTLQIYFDFSGYSDMAIGLASMFGFSLKENFNLPYISKTISEFWRRWHISLSTWFRDYVYIPLGGNKKHVYFNLFIVFFLTGVWHGASLTFFAWGLYNGFFIILERLFRLNKKDRKFSFLSSVIFRIYTLLAVNIGWVLFRAPDLKSAMQFLQKMIGKLDAPKNVYEIGWFLDNWTLTALILGILFSTSIPSKLSSFVKNNLPSKIIIPPRYTIALALFVLSILHIVSGTYNPFIYFQF